MTFNFSINTFLYFLVFLFFSCNGNYQEVKKLINSPDLKKDKADDVQIIFSKNGNTKAVIKAKEFIQNNDILPAYIEMRKGLVVDFYNDELKIDNTLSAKYGRFYEQEKNVLVKDSVVVHNIKNEKLETEELIWDEKRRLFHTTKFVKITTPTKIIFGDGLEANQNFTYYKITNVQGIIDVPKDKIPTL